MDTLEGGNYWGLCGCDANWDRYWRAADSGRVTPESVVTFTFPGAPELNTARRVPSDGKLTLPVVGEINVKNRLVADVEKELVARYGARLPSKQVAVGFQPPPSDAFMRFSGGGCYAGVPVVLISLWAALQALRRRDSVFSPAQQKLLWYWIAVAVVSLLLAFGRYAPFYQFVYKLPFFSTMRNPAKFVHLVTFAMLMLFGYGVDGLWRRYLQVPSLGPAGLAARFKSWWGQAAAFDRRWVIGCLAALGASVVGWLIYGSARPALERYLQNVQFGEQMAHAIAGFSIGQVGWFVLFLALSVGLLTLILSGTFSGTRSKIGVTLLGILLVVDLALANLPWILYWDLQQKYATNPIIEELRERPYEHRVARLPFNPPPQLQTFNDLYRIEWAQHTFLYYNIQSLDVVQMPRRPEDLTAYEVALSPDGTTNTVHRIARRWQLTNTRYLLGPAPYLEALNLHLDPGQHRFRIAATFDLAFKPGVAQATKLEELTVTPRPDGPYALLEFTGALPRAKLYANWQVNTNDAAVLEQLASREFNPESSVFVAGGVPPSPPTPPGTNQNAGTVQFDSYIPRDFVLKANATAPSVLLVNDHFDPDWRVYVDGKPAPLLRCNFIMRGVYVTPGAHQVEFRYEPPMKALYVSLAAVIVALLLCGVVVVGAREAGGAAEPEPEVAAKPAKAVKPAEAMKAGRR
jgi:hypothetical protein